MSSFFACVSIPFNHLIKILSRVGNLHIIISIVFCPTTIRLNRTFSALCLRASSRSDRFGAIIFYFYGMEAWPFCSHPRAKFPMDFHINLLHAHCQWTIHFLVIYPSTTITKVRQSFILEQYQHFLSLSTEISFPLFKGF